jgi:hypothetical protein
MHPAEYLAQTVARLLKQRAELQRLRQAVAAAGIAPSRGRRQNPSCVGIRSGASHATLGQKQIQKHSLT